MTVNVVPRVTVGVSTTFFGDYIIEEYLITPDDRAYYIRGIDPPDTYQDVIITD